MSGQSKKSFPCLAYDGKASATHIIASTPCARLRAVKRFGDVDEGCANMLIRGDNLFVLKTLLQMKEAGGFANSGVRLVYIDPPFSTRLAFKGRCGGLAYDDKLQGAEFIEFLRMRLILLRELLSDDGSIYLHLDGKTSHYMKVVMDEVFGQENFLNEIVWNYGGRGAKAASSQFPRNHDILLLYRKKTHVFNKQWSGRRMLKGASGFKQDSDGRWFKTAPRGDYTDASIAALDKAGRVYRTAMGRLRIKYFLREEGDTLIEDRPVGDVWDDIADAMHIGKAEKTGYPTQKPVALLERVIKASSNPGDIVLDAFCGSGTTLVTAQKLGRRWIGIDSGAMAVKTVLQRLEGVDGFVVYEAEKG